MSIPAGTTIGKYTVRTKLAEGGMAEIYLCSALGPEGFSKDVVIKRVRPHLASDPTFVDMFVAEARLASRLNHRNVIQIFDFDRHEDTYYLAMEYVRGASLWELRRRCREQCIAIPPVLAAHIGAEVAHGLAYAHRLADQGQPLHIVHRDVTPHNILLSFEGAVKLTDFGIARASDHSTAPGVLKGKFAYMSPEQGRGDPVDARTDIFALGVVLWEMLTGGRLFEGDSDLAILRAVQKSEIPPPARLNPDVPEALDAAVMRALQRDINRRYQTATELARALTEVVLQHARTFDDTDVGTFLRRVVGEQEVPAAPKPKDSAPIHERETRPDPRPSEPTAVMPGRGSGLPGSRELIPDGRQAEPTSEELSRERTVALPRGSKARSTRPEDDATPLHRAVAPAQTDDAPAKARAVPRTESLSAQPRRRMAPFVWGALAVLAGASTAGAFWAWNRRTEVPQSRAVASSGAADVAEPAEGPGTPLVATGAVEHATPTADGGTASLEASPPAAAGSENTGLPEAAPAAGVVPAGGTVTGEAAQASQPAAGTVKQPTGTLLLKVFPFAQVTIDGRDFGEASGSRSISLPTGEHVLVLRHAHRTRRMQVVVKADRTVSVDFNAFKVQ